jgi:hypothetical protein
MTEAEAYKMLGWPTTGGELGGPYRFVLPLSGSLDKRWIVITCANPACAYKGLSVPEALESKCQGCGSLVVFHYTLEAI